MKRVTAILALESFYSLTDKLLRRFRRRISDAPRGVTACLCASRRYEQSSRLRTIFPAFAVWRFSQSFGCVIRESRALAAHERDVAAVGPTLHAIDDVSQARAAFGQIRRIDLRDVAETNDFGTRTGARDQRLHLLGREILGFVDDQVLVDERAPAHEI